MRIATKAYVAAIVVIALGWQVANFWFAAPLPRSTVTDALLLCGLAVAAELLSFFMPKSATGSLGFIAYLAAGIVVPAWPTVLCVVIVKTTAEICLRRQPIKATLNVASHALTLLVAITLYSRLGGKPLGEVGDLLNFAHVTRVAAGPALLAIVLALPVNNFTVTTAIAISSRRSIASVLRGNHNRINVGADFLAVPLVFVFAWVYVAFGAVAAATLWVPILGLRQVHRTNLELEQTNEELLELMVKSIEARDPYTSGHSRRVQQFSTIIARAIGMSDKDVDQVGRAALLHDVGKIYEKYAGVLSKQDKLTPEEWAVIQEHPVDGANLVATMTRLRDLVPAVRHHHENWDGTGYPDRIAGEAIPVAARIIRFADTIDAMTTERPYRGPLSEAQVRSEVMRCRGTQFDPEIADKLLSSALWFTLFAPASNDRSIQRPIALVGRPTPSRVMARLGVKRA